MAVTDQNILKKEVVEKPAGLVVNQSVPRCYLRSLVALGTLRTL